MTLIEFDRNELDNHPEEYNKLLLYILERKKIEVLLTQHSFEPKKKREESPIRIHTVTIRKKYVYTR